MIRITVLTEGEVFATMEEGLVAFWRIENHAPVRIIEPLPAGDHRLKLDTSADVFPMEGWEKDHGQ